MYVAYEELEKEIKKADFNCFDCGNGLKVWERWEEKCYCTDITIKGKRDLVTIGSVDKIQYEYAQIANEEIVDALKNGKKKKIREKYEGKEISVHLDYETLENLRLLSKKNGRNITDEAENIIKDGMKRIFAKNEDKKEITITKEELKKIIHDEIPECLKSRGIIV